MNTPAGIDEAKSASAEVLVIRTPAIPACKWAVYFKELWLLANNLSFGCQKWYCNCSYRSKSYLVICSLCSEK